MSFITYLIPLPTFYGSFSDIDWSYTDPLTMGVTPVAYQVRTFYYWQIGAAVGEVNHDNKPRPLLAF